MWDVENYLVMSQLTDLPTCKLAQKVCVYSFNYCECGNFFKFAGLELFISDDVECYVFLLRSCYITFFIGTWNWKLGSWCLFSWVFCSFN